MPPVKTVLFSCVGTFYQYSGEEGSRPHYDPLGEQEGFVIALEKHKTSPSGTCKYLIVVSEDGEAVFEQTIGAELQLSYSDEAASVHWAGLIEDDLQTVAFRFAVPGGQQSQVTPRQRMQEFVALYNRCTYSLLTGYEEVDTQDEWYDYLAGAATHEVRNEDLTEPVFELDEERMSVAGTGTGNICAAESMQFNRVLVVKKSNEADSLELHAVAMTERGFSREEAERVAVKRVDNTATDTLMASGDIKMLLFGGQTGAVHEVDLTRGEVVQEYKPQDLDIRAVSYANHTSSDSGSVYTCLSRNVAFNIDTRLDPSRCVVAEAGKQPTDYALSSLRNNFTCHATSRNGYLVIGDGAGNIRLYTGPPGSRKPGSGYFPKAAKTLLETKIPVLDIDVTSDGAYIVATTTKRLLFIETRYLDKDERETNGFEGRMGAHKPRPTVLEPTPAQMKRLGGADAVCFSGAKFDRFPGTKELCVTASCGDYVLTWSLRSILASQTSGRSVVNSAVTVGRAVIATTANRSDNVGFLTGENVGLVPFHEAKKQVSREWTWGQEK